MTPSYLSRSATCVVELLAKVRVVSRPVVCVFTGLPGTGKSTIADLSGRWLPAPAFAGDWLLGALKPAARVLKDLDRATMMQVYRNLLTSLVTRQLLLGQSAVVDGLATDELLTEWRERADAHGAAFATIECVCSDRSVHRQRVEGRRRNIPGWHEIDWDHVERMRAEAPPLTVPHLTLDALDALDRNTQLMKDYVREALAA
jgi:predicted kinase